MYIYTYIYTYTYIDLHVHMRLAAPSDGGEGAHLIGPDAAATRIVEGVVQEVRGLDAQVHVVVRVRVCQYGSKCVRMYVHTFYIDIGASKHTHTHTHTHTHGMYVHTFYIDIGASWNRDRVAEPEHRRKPGRAHLCMYICVCVYIYIYMYISRYIHM